MPASKDNVVSVTVDLSECAGGGLPLNQPVKVELSASTAGLPTDSTSQTFFVESVRQQPAQTGLQPVTRVYRRSAPPGKVKADLHLLQGALRSRA